MQTFVPYACFTDSAAVLDNKRLQKQAVETYQIMLVLLGLKPVMNGTELVGFEGRDPKGWKNHPAVKMWRGHEIALLAYQRATCDELAKRPRRDGSARKVTLYRKTLLACVAGLSFEDAPAASQLPSWHGDEELHASHRSNLLRKDPVWYGKYGWKEPATLEYKWPA